MKRLRTAIERIFGIPLDLLRLPRGLRLIGAGDPDALLFGSRDAVERPLLTQEDMREFVRDAPPVGHCQVGFGGYGVNSHAFYCSRVTQDSKVYFRLPFGGIYGDERLEARRVRSFLLAFLEFETAVRHSARELLAIDSMGVGQYRLMLGGWPLRVHRASMLKSPAFQRVFGLVPSAQPGVSPTLPHIGAMKAYNAYALFTGPDGGFRRRRVGRYMIVDENLRIISDSYGLLSETFPAGPMHPSRYDALAALSRGRRFQVVPEDSDPCDRRGYPDGWEETSAARLFATD